MKQNDLREALANIKRIQAHEDTVTAFRAHDATIKKYEAALERLDIGETPFDELVALVVDAERRADEFRRRLRMEERKYSGALRCIVELKEDLEVLIRYRGLD